jgi:hypothetical protein
MHLGIGPAVVLQYGDRYLFQPSSVQTSIERLDAKLGCGTQYAVELAKEMLVLRQPFLEGPDDLLHTIELASLRFNLDHERSTLNQKPFGQRRGSHRENGTE